jgi:hypothetical protein
MWTTLRSSRGAVTGHTQCDTRYLRREGWRVEPYLRPAPPQGPQLPLPPQVPHFEVTHVPFRPLPLQTQHRPLPLQAAHGFFATIDPSGRTGVLYITAVLEGRVALLPSVPLVVNLQ